VNLDAVLDVIASTYAVSKTRELVTHSTTNVTNIVDVHGEFARTTLLMIQQLMKSSALRV
jgi:hypothetical protein